MRKEAIKNENYLSLRQLRTIAPGFRLHRVVRRPRTPAAPLGSRQPPPSVDSVRAQLQPSPSAPTAAAAVYPHTALPAWEPGAGPLPAAPFSPALAPHTRKWTSSLNRPLGGPWGGPLRCPEAQEELQPGERPEPAALSHHRPQAPNEVPARRGDPAAG